MDQPLHCATDGRHLTEARPATKHEASESPDERANKRQKVSHQFKEDEVAPLRKKYEAEIERLRKQNVQLIERVDGLNDDVRVLEREVAEQRDLLEVNAEEMSNEGTTMENDSSRTAFHKRVAAAKREIKNRHDQTTKRMKKKHDDDIKNLRDKIKELKEEQRHRVEELEERHRIHLTSIKKSYNDRLTSKDTIQKEKQDDYASKIESLRRENFNAVVCYKQLTADLKKEKRQMKAELEAAIKRHKPETADAIKAKNIALQHKDAEIQENRKQIAILELRLCTKEAESKKLIESHEQYEKAIADVQQMLVQSTKSVEYYAKCMLNIDSTFGNLKNAFDLKSNSNQEQSRRVVDQQRVNYQLKNTNERLARNVARLESELSEARTTVLAAQPLLNPQEVMEDMSEGFL